MIRVFSLSEDWTRLDIEVAVTDEATFTAPAVLKGYWLARGDSILTYDCLPIEQ